MPQKVLIKVAMSDSKKSAITKWVCVLAKNEESRTKAMKIAATFSGVESVTIKGDNKDQIEVIGDGIDTVELAKLLRKNVGHADLVSVGPAKDEKKEEKKPEVKKIEALEAPIIWGSIPYAYNSYPVYEFRDSSYNSGCSIL